MHALGCPGLDVFVGCARLLALQQPAGLRGAHVCMPGLGPMTMWKISDTSFWSALHMTTCVMLIRVYSVLMAPPIVVLMRWCRVF
jgi:hypothetical protein